MSLFQRITRAFDTLSTIELDEQSRFGALGELYAEQILDDGQAICITNPIVPHPTRPGLFLESDFLIYTQGSLFCVEIKHYKGRLFYPTGERVGQVSPTRRSLARPALQGFDDSIIIQEKIGNYGEGIFLKEHRNPLKKTRYFIHHLKDYLVTIDARCKKVYIIPVVGFSELADIRAIYDFEVGMISTSQLPAFFEQHSGPAAAAPPPSWLRSALYRVPTWDLILTTRNEWINGVITDRELLFQGTDRHSYCLPYCTLHTVALQRGGLFSAADQLTVTDVRGHVSSYHSVRGEVHVRRFGGETQTHQLRNINQIVVGIANKLG
jgi:hypothetical protein